MSEYVAPAFNKDGFDCPHCDTVAHQTWYALYVGPEPVMRFNRAPGPPPIYVGDFNVVQCFHCKKHSIWLDKEMIYPPAANIPLPNSDMSNDLKQIYDEAGKIVSLSPRSSSALLRLLVEKLLKNVLGSEAKDNLYTNIELLVDKGLSKDAENSLNAVRLNGNRAIHPGKIDLDDATIPLQLFNIINYIVEYFISLPKTAKLLSKPTSESSKKPKKQDASK